MIQLSNIGPPGRMRFARGSNPVFPRHQLREQCGDRSDRLPPHPAARPRATMPGKTLLVLGLEFRDDFVAFRNGKEAANECGGDRRQPPGTRILWCGHSTM